jgi:hypothetical protein
MLTAARELVVCVTRAIFLRYTIVLLLSMIPQPSAKGRTGQAHMRTTAQVFP